MLQIGYLTIGQLMTEKELGNYEKKSVGTVWFQLRFTFTEIE